jgi:crossover junction endodeoxyribonuclease RuvC
MDPSALLGVDPGASGALALVECDSGQLLELADMPYTEVKVGKRNAKIVDAPALAALIEGWQAWHLGTFHAIVEKVSAMPGQGVTSTFNFGDAYGKVLGVLAGLEIKATLYRPGIWKSHMGLGKDKDLSRQKAAGIWPGQADMFKRKKDDGRAEAALIAEYHRRLTEGYVP